MLSRTDVLKPRPLPVKKVPTPEWAAEGQDPAEAFVFVRGMRAREKDAWENAVSYAARADGQRRCTDDLYRAKLAAATVCDADGALLFTEADVELLGQQDARPLDRIAEAAQPLSSISAADRAALLGNSGAGQPA